MPFGRAFRRLLSLPRREAGISRDVDDEVAFHLDMRARELAAAGMPEEEARRRAHAEFGDLTRARRALAAEDRARAGEERRATWRDELGQDLRYAWRQLLRAPSFSAVAVLTLALGIGANSAIFSVVNGVLLRPLPYESPDRLVRLFSFTRERRSALSVPDFYDYRAQARSFDALAAYYDGTTNLTGRGEPERLLAARVTGDFFRALGARPLLGRLFAEGDDEESAPEVTVLSEGLWRRSFGSDPSVVGQTLSLDGRPTTVIGVLPGATVYPEDAELWLGARFTANDRAPDNRGARWLRVIGRLRDGATITGAEADVKAIAGRLEEGDRKHNTGYTAVLVPLHEAMVGELRRPLFVLLGAVALVMLIACVNVANLLLARAATRGTELAVRASLGAGRGRIVRQLLTESMLLAACGALAGLPVAAAGVRALVGFAPPGTPRLAGVRLDGTVVLVTIALALVTGLLFGLAPVVQTSLSELSHRLREGSRGMAGRAGHARLRRSLVVSEIALAVMLLVGAGLLMRSFAALRNVDPGFDPDRIVSFTVTLPASSYEPLASQRRFVTQATERLAAIPGVREVGATFGLPLTDTRFSLSFKVPEHPPVPPEQEPSTQVRVASPGYFRVMQIPLKRGRLLEPTDRWESPPVVVISEELAKRHFPNEDPLGKHLQMGWTRDGHQLGGEIVGVVGDVKSTQLRDDALPFTYAALDQWPIDELTFVLKTAGAEASLGPAVREVMHGLDANLPIFDYRTLDDVVSSSLAQPRFYFFLLAAFAAVAVGLAAIGIYGVIAYAVQQRTREIGVRMALGATRERVTAMVVREGLQLSTAGVVVGLAGAFALTQLLRTLVFGVGTRDPVTFAAVAVVLAAVALLACAIPARRAARVDPQQALRSE